MGGGYNYMPWSLCHPLLATLSFQAAIDAMIQESERLREEQRRIMVRQIFIRHWSKDQWPPGKTLEPRICYIMKRTSILWYSQMKVLWITLFLLVIASMREIFRGGSLPRDPPGTLEGVQSETLLPAETGCPQGRAIEEMFRNHSHQVTTISRCWELKGWCHR